MARILIADDEAPIANLIAFRLRNEGHEVVLAHDGARTIAAAVADKPDLVVLDVMMPIFTGMEVLARFRDDPILKRLPVILLSARAHEDDVVAGLSAGAVDYVVKPFSIRELSARIAVALRGR